MRRSFKVVSFLTALVLTLGWLGNAFAEVSKPFFTVAASSYNEFIGNMKTIGDVAANPAFATMIEFPIQMWVGQDLMDAADKDALLGIAVQQVNDTQGIIFCLPVDDPEILADFIVEKAESGDYTEEEDGVLSLEMDGTNLYLKKVGAWTCIVTEREQIETIPEDVTEIFPKYENSTISVTFNMAELPEELKEIFVANFKEGAALGITEKIEGESDEDYQLRKDQADAAGKMIDDLFKSITCLYFVLRVDADSKSMILDMTIDCVPGS